MTGSPPSNTRTSASSGLASTSVGKSISSCHLSNAMLGQVCPAVAMINSGDVSGIAVCGTFCEFILEQVCEVGDGSAELV